MAYLCSHARRPARRIHCRANDWNAWVLSVRLRTISSGPVTDLASGPRRMLFAWPETVLEDMLLSSESAEICQALTPYHVPSTTSVSARVPSCHRTLPSR